MVNKMATGDKVSSDIVVLFSTYNGAANLKKVLSGYINQEAVNATWSLVVVDNNSTDETANILKENKSRLPINILHESTPGKNVSLNRAIEVIQAKIIIFTDDDAIPNASFIKDWSRILLEYPNIQIFAGRIDPEFERSPPKWLRSDILPFDILYAQCDRPEGIISARLVFGPNMAVRGHIFSDGYRFDETIGPSSDNKNYAMGSETEFCTRVEKHGGVCLFLKGPKVSHIVRPWQMSHDFIRGRAKRYGRGHAGYILVHEGANPWLNIRGLRFLPHSVRQGVRKIRRIFSKQDNRIKLEWEINSNKAFYSEMKDYFKRLRR